MRINYILALLTTFLLWSCTNDEPTPPQKTDNEKPSLRTPEEVANYIQLLVDEIDKQNPSRGGSRRVVSNVSAVKYCQTQSRGPNNLGTQSYRQFDTVYYIVNFVDSSGFAFAGALPESEPVYAIMDHGNLNWGDLDNPDIRYKYFNVLNFMDVAILGSDISYPTGNSNEVVDHIKGWDILSAKAPILKTKWSQRSPYSKYCSNNVVGCVGVAVAQLLSYFRTLESFPDPTTEAKNPVYLDWDYIISVCNDNNGAIPNPKYETPVVEQVSKLCRYIGKWCDAEYNKDGTTSMKSKKAIEFFKKVCHLKSSGLKGYNENAIVNSLKTGIPVYGRGNSSRTKFLFWDVAYGGGHAWVYDGYVICCESNDPSNKKKTLLHCNWGWDGRDNGYFLSKVFDTSLVRLNDEDIQEDMFNSRSDSNDDGKDYDYRYNLEYATLWK